MTLQQAFELNIFSLPELRDLPLGEKEKLTQKMSEEILASVAEEIASELPEDKAEEFVALFSAPRSPEERAAFLNTHVPNFEEILIRETLSFKEYLAEFMKDKLQNKSEDDTLK